LHAGNFFFQIVRVLISVPVTEALHESCRGIAKVQRDGLGGGSLDILLNVAIRGVSALDFGATER